MQTIFAASKPRIVLPLLFGLAICYFVAADNQMSSKWLNNALYKCGFTVNYDEVSKSLHLILIWSYFVSPLSCYNSVYLGLNFYNEFGYGSGSLSFFNYIYFHRHVLSYNSTCHTDTFEFWSVKGYNKNSTAGCMQVYTAEV